MPRGGRIYGSFLLRGTSPRGREKAFSFQSLLFPPFAGKRRGPGSPSAGKKMLSKEELVPTLLLRRRSNPTSQPSASEKEDAVRPKEKVGAVKRVNHSMRAAKAPFGRWKKGEK